MKCNICGKVMCDHSPTERGQTLQEMTDSLYEDIKPLAQQAIGKRSEKDQKKKDLVDVVLNVGERKVVVKGSPEYVNDKVYRAPPKNSRALAIVKNFGVNYAKAFHETKEGQEMLNPQELEELLKKCQVDEDRYQFWFSNERPNLVGGNIFRGFAYWTPYGVGIAPKESQYANRLILAKVGKVFKSRNGRIKVLPDDKTATTLPESILTDYYWIKGWEFDSERGITIPKFTQKKELWDDQTIFLNLTRYESRPSFAPLIFGYDECINCVKSYFSNDFGGLGGKWVELEIPSPNESPSLEWTNPRELFGVWKKCL